MMIRIKRTVADIPSYQILQNIIILIKQNYKIECFYAETRISNYGSQ